MSETTKEKFWIKNNLLVKRSDISRVAGHPIVDDESLLQLADGANFHVCVPYEKLKELVIHG